MGVGKVGVGGGRTWPPSHFSDGQLGKRSVPNQADRMSMGHRANIGGEQTLPPVGLPQPPSQYKVERDTPLLLPHPWPALPQPPSQYKVERDTPLLLPHPWSAPPSEIIPILPPPTYIFISKGGFDKDNISFYSYEVMMH